MESLDYFRQKAAQCRRLAYSMPTQNDPAHAALLAMAQEFDAKAEANQLAMSKGAWLTVQTKSQARKGTLR